MSQGKDEKSRGEQEQSIFSPSGQSAFVRVDAKSGQLPSRLSAPLSQPHLALSYTAPLRYPAAFAYGQSQPIVGEFSFEAINPYLPPAISPYGYPMYPPLGSATGVPVMMSGFSSLLSSLSAPLSRGASIAGSAFSSAPSSVSLSSLSSEISHPSESLMTSAPLTTLSLSAPHADSKLLSEEKEVFPRREHEIAAEDDRLRVSAIRSFEQIYADMVQRHQSSPPYFTFHDEATRFASGGTIRELFSKLHEMIGLPKFSNVTQMRNHLTTAAVLHPDKILNLLSSCKQQQLSEDKQVRQKYARILASWKRVFEFLLLEEDCQQLVRDELSFFDKALDVLGILEEGKKIFKAKFSSAGDAKNSQSNVSPAVPSSLPQADITGNKRRRIQARRPAGVLRGQGAFQQIYEEMVANQKRLAAASPRYFNETRFYSGRSTNRIYTKLHQIIQKFPQRGTTEKIKRALNSAELLFLPSFPEFFCKEDLGLWKKTLEFLLLDSNCKNFVTRNRDVFLSMLSYLGGSIEIFNRNFPPPAAAALPTLPGIMLYSPPRPLAAAKNLSSQIGSQPSQEQSLDGGSSSTTNHMLGSQD